MNQLEIFHIPDNFFVNRNVSFIRGKIDESLSDEYLNAQR